MIHTARNLRRPEQQQQHVEGQVHEQQQHRCGNRTGANSNRCDDGFPSCKRRHRGSSSSGTTGTVRRRNDRRSDATSDSLLGTPTTYKQQQRQRQQTRRSERTTTTAMPLLVLYGVSTRPTGAGSHRSRNRNRAWAMTFAVVLVLGFLSPRCQAQEATATPSYAPSPAVAEIQQTAAVSVEDVAAACGEVGDPCVQEDNFAVCRDLVLAGCTEILKLESCPLGFECAGDLATDVEQVAATEPPTAAPPSDGGFVPITLPPFETPPPDTGAPTAPTEITDAPTAKAPTVAPTTDEPTILPTDALTEAATTETPTTMEPTTAAPTTTEPTTAAPTTMEPTTAAPTTAAPTTLEPTTMEPSTVEPSTLEPTLDGGETIEPTVSMAPTLPGTPANATVESIMAFYAGVTLLTETQVIQILSTTKFWFQQSYNNVSFVDGGRRMLRGQGDYHRRLQFNPAELGIRNMQTDLTFVGQAANASGVELYYTQYLQYVETVSTQNPESLILLPYIYPPTNVLYGEALRANVNDFEGLILPFDIPDVPIPETEAPTTAPTEEPPQEGWTMAALAGTIVGCVIGVPVLAYVTYLCFKQTSYTIKSTKQYFEDRRERRYNQSVGDGHGYVSAGTAPPSHFNVTSSGEEVSTMDDPTKVGPADTYDGDYEPSVATVDYDYSKAYGGGVGGASVVSSVGGTLGDNTRTTNPNEAAASATRARAALGASFDADGIDRDNNGSNVREEVIEIDAPAGKLGVVIDTPDDGAPVVHAVKDSSVIADLIQVGDKLIAVDNEDVRSMTAIKVSKLISKKSNNPSRKLTIVRTTFVDDSEG